MSRFNKICQNMQNTIFYLSSLESNVYIICLYFGISNKNIQICINPSHNILSITINYQEKKIANLDFKYKIINVFTCFTHIMI